MPLLCATLRINSYKRCINEKKDWREEINEELFDRIISTVLAQLNDTTRDMNPR